MGRVNLPRKVIPLVTEANLTVSDVAYAFQGDQEAWGAFSNEP